jgi:general secretion pathway protein M
MTVSPWISRLAAVALLTGVLVVFYAFLMAPLLAGYGEIDLAISRTSELLDRYRRVAASHDAFHARLEELMARQSEIGVYIGGSTDALAGAELQELVNKTVEKGGGRLRSVQILPVETDGEFRRVGVRVQMTANVVQLTQVLYAIEAGRTFLFVDNLDVSNRRARRRRNQPVNMDPTLLIRLDLSGYLRPEAG